MPDNETLRVQLNYPLERVKEPVLYHLVMDYGLIPNIRRANIDSHPALLPELNDLPADGWIRGHELDCQTKVH